MQIAVTSASTKSRLTVAINCTAVISTFGKDWMAQRILQLVEVMRLQGLQPVVITYAAVNGACGKGWMAERALRLREEI